MKNYAGTVTLTSDRLLLRPFRIEDAQAMYQTWTSDPEVTRFLTWSPHQSVEETKLLLASWCKRYRDTQRSTVAVTLKDTGELIGSFCAMTTIRRKTLMIGYSYGKAFWGKGYATEAAKRVVLYLFSETPCDTVTARYHIDNKASGRVLAKTGLVTDFRKTEFVATDRGMVECYRCTLKKEEKEEEKGSFFQKSRFFY